MLNRNPTRTPKRLRAKRPSSGAQVGESIRAARKAKRLTQEQVSDRIGVAKSTVSGWESGSFPPDPASAKALIELLPSLTLDAIYAAVPARKAA